MKSNYFITSSKVSLISSCEWFVDHFRGIYKVRRPRTGVQNGPHALQLSFPSPKVTNSQRFPYFPVGMMRWQLCVDFISNFYVINRAGIRKMWHLVSITNNKPSVEIGWLPEGHRRLGCVLLHLRLCRSCGSNPPVFTGQKNDWSERRWNWAGGECTE